MGYLIKMHMDTITFIYNSEKKSPRSSDAAGVKMNLSVCLIIEWYALLKEGNKMINS